MGIEGRTRPNEQLEGFSAAHLSPTPTIVLVGSYGVSCLGVLVLKNNPIYLRHVFCRAVMFLNVASITHGPDTLVKYCARTVLWVWHFLAAQTERVPFLEHSNILLSGSGFGCDDGDGL